MSIADVDVHGWRASAVCLTTDHELWFPEHGQTSATAKRICGGCPVTTECLSYALAHGERYGVWGGYSERERRRLRSAAA